MNDQQPTLQLWLNGAIIPVNPTLTAIILGLVDQRQKIESLTSGEVEIHFGIYQAKVRVIPPSQVYKLSREEGGGEKSLGLHRDRTVL
jgi:hypothetical protein